MATATKTVSARIPKSLFLEALALRPETKQSEMMREAFSVWVKWLRREHEDDLIRQALASGSGEQKRDERELAGLAGRSSLKALERDDG